MVVSYENIVNYQDTPRISQSLCSLKFPNYAQLQKSISVNPGLSFIQIKKTEKDSILSKSERDEIKSQKFTRSMSAKTVK